MSDPFYDVASLDYPIVDADAHPASAGLQVFREHRLSAATYRLPREKVWAPLKWPGGQIHGQVEIDIGYANYKYPERQDRPEETLHDMRGRFVLGPMFRRELDEGLYLTVLAQLVAWVREQEQQY